MKTRTPALPRLLLLLLLLAISALLSSCSGTAELPREARHVLEARLQAIAEIASDQSGARRTFRIVRAWPGIIPPASELELPAAIEVWCVEVEERPAPAGESGSFTWFISRSNPTAQWEVIPLMAMSSIWPFQACGVFDG